MSLREKMVWVCVLLAALCAPIGCSRKEQVDQKQQMSGATPPVDSGTSGSPPPRSTVVDTTNAVAEVFSRIHEHESTLSQIIAAGRLNELGVEARSIRDLLGRAVDLVQIPSDQRTEFEGHVSEAKRAAIALGEAGKAGSMERSKARNAELQKELGAVEQMVIQHRISRDTLP